MKCSRWSIALGPQGYLQSTAHRTGEPVHLGPRQDDTTTVDGLLQDRPEAETD
jgi:hypothetical protein